MIVRDATDSDMPSVLKMARDFYSASGYDKDGPFDEAHTMINIGGIRHSGFLLVAEQQEKIVGMVAMVYGAGLCNPARKAHEVVFWVSPETRGGFAALALIRAADKRAKESDCVGAQMAHLTNSPEQVSSVYSRLGYAKTETYYTKHFGVH